jgi:hypothetical protein
MIKDIVVNLPVGIECATVHFRDAGGNRADAPIG